MKAINLRKTFFVAMIVVTMVLVGCRSTPVYNVTDMPVTASSNAKAEDVKKAIFAAGASLGWQMKEVEPGHIVGSLFVRKHSAIVDIPYSTESYSIQYKDSTELGYDGTNIHSNYNGWIQNLNRAIQVRLALL